MDHASVTDKCLVKVIRNNKIIKETIGNEEWERELASRFLAKEFIKIILRKGEKNETQR